MAEITFVDIVKATANTLIGIDAVVTTVNTVVSGQISDRKAVGLMIDAAALAALNAK